MVGADRLERQTKHHRHRLQLLCVAAHLVQDSFDDDLVNLSEAQKVLVEAKAVVCRFGRQRSCQPGRNVQQTDEPADPLQLLRLFGAVPKLTGKPRILI